MRLERLMGAVRFSGRRKSNEMKGSTICGRGDCRAGDDLWHTVCVKVCDKGDLLVVVVDKARIRRIPEPALSSTTTQHSLPFGGCYLQQLCHSSGKYDTYIILFISYIKHRNMVCVFVHRFVRKRGNSVGHLR